MPMDISITGDLEEFVKSEVAAGHYATADEVVVDALRKHISATIDRQISDRVAQSRAEFEAGDYVIADDQFIADKISRMKDKIGAPSD